MKLRQNYKAILGIIVSVIIVAAFGLSLYLIESRADARADAQMEKAQAYTVNPSVLLYDEEEDLTYCSYHDIDTFLFIGTDASGDEQGTGEEYAGNLADFLLLAVIDHTDKTYGFLQIHRDTITDVPILQTDGTAYSSAEQQICLAHFYGADPQMSGANTLAAAGNLLLGMEIGGYYAVHMDEVPRVNRLLGGVEITFAEDLTQIDPSFIKGETVTLSDAQAEAFVRARMGVGNGKNDERMDRQLIYMNAAMKQAKQKMSQDKQFVNTFYDAFSDIAVTDMTKSHLTNLASKTLSYTSKGILKLDGESTTGVSSTDGIEHERFYADKASVLATLETLCGGLEEYHDETEADDGEEIYDDEAGTDDEEIYDDETEADDEEIYDDEAETDE